METLDVFLQKIRAALDRSAVRDYPGGYVDLAVLEGPELLPAGPELHRGSPALPWDAAGDTAPPDNLVSFQEILLEEIARCHADKVKLGINEMLKHLLAVMDRDAEEILAKLYMYRLGLIFKRCLLPDFPYPEEIWNYICDCLRSVDSYLLERGYFTAAGEIVDALAGLGRIAASRGLPTANTQSSLRILENKARSKGENQLASMAKNARFNLES